MTHGHIYGDRRCTCSRCNGVNPTFVKKAQTAAQARMAAAKAEAGKALAENRCPCCGKGVRQNLALTGWVQCEQFGAPTFRKDSSLPSCDWQGFTH